MRPIKGELSPKLADLLGKDEPAKAEAIPIDSYQNLMEHIAHLSYANKDHLLFFRGQHIDFQNRAGSSSFYPSIYRGERLSRDELLIRFDILNGASQRLIDAFETEAISGWRDVKRRKYIQWSILQHYEICPTPLLDFTHSIRVASSFATLNNRIESSFVYVFGLPYLTNRISINSEQYIVNVRLLSICPPDALRPYYQEGYLAGTDEITTDYESKYELDFTNRLIAKFSIVNNKKFWSVGFSPLTQRVLYPRGDRIHQLCKKIAHDVSTGFNSGELGRFLQSWVQLERNLLNAARRTRERIFSVREAIDALSHDELLVDDMREKLHELRSTRNVAVHNPSKLKPGQLATASSQIEALTQQFQSLLPKHTQR